MPLNLGPGRPPQSPGDILAMPDFVSDFDPEPGEPLLDSGVGLDMPHFASDCDILQIQDFECAINPGHGETSPESGDILAVPDISVTWLGPEVRSPGIGTVTAVTV